MATGEKNSASYGSWKSPITADIVSGSDKRLEGFNVDSHGHLIWLETRPAESGRAVLVKESGEDITPKDFNVRNTVHEYGGGSFGVSGDVLVFSNFDDQRLYKQTLTSSDSGTKRLSRSLSVLIASSMSVPINDCASSSSFDLLLLLLEIIVGSTTDPAPHHFPTPKLLFLRLPEPELRAHLCLHGQQGLLLEGAEDVLVLFFTYSGPVPITPDYAGPHVRYADGVFDGRLNRYIAVREDHRGVDAKPTNEIVSVVLNDNTTEEPKVLISGNDFYAFPRMDLKGERLAWIEWSHPNMHWDKAELWVGYISESGDIEKRVVVAGGCRTLVESPTEPLWSSKGRIRELFFITDRNTGFWNIYKWIEDKNEVLAIYSLNAEFTRPFWVFGNRCYDIIERKEESTIIACSYRQHGKSYLGVINQAKNSFCSVDIPFTYISNIVASGQILYIEGASSVLPTSLAKVILDDRMSNVVDFSIMWSSSSDIDKYIPYFSRPEFIEFPTDVAGQIAYAYFYPPCNPEYNGSQEEKPPLLLESHGGPTDEAHGTLNLSIQYWTSRGWAFVDVNYGGSTGYGRAYRERLLGKWGIVDINDCCSCAEYLVDEGKVDGKRLCITGCSAGGYTTLASLAFRDTFRAGASLFGAMQCLVSMISALFSSFLYLDLLHFSRGSFGNSLSTSTRLLPPMLYCTSGLGEGIGDLKSLSDHMHKFESHYIINLAGNEIALNERSPINFVDRFSCPIIVFQGLEDTVVQPEQARKIYEALKKKGLPVALVEYEGESHGFRKAESIKFTLEQQMMFFARTVGQFAVADDITPTHIDNFD
ncbi:hypothetical protein MTR67_044663 [Solanum verrucosum]|uniref:Peptidase S9 prolyl oligopeptidase catalytic domain-containing protein n=1 Tax=Solanum verrucosum TaxID=315347 RepID=A0AAF0UQX4_SOLVR|nr:hypothetical protein MTR67_044663 [Solanum verrucosum]